MAYTEYSGPMDLSLEQRVGHEVEGWLRWLPRWRPGTHRGRTRLCRQCFGSPVMAAAGLATDVPHAVQHAFAMRMKLVVDAAVDAYTDQHLPHLARELHRAEERRARRPYRPAEGLEPEFTGLDLDPQPVEGAPFLFTFADLADAELADVERADAESAEVADESPQRRLRPPPLSAAEKAAIRAELTQSDVFAAQFGRALCLEIDRHREQIQAAVAQHVEPRVQELLAALESSLDEPRWPR